MSTTKLTAIGAAYGGALLQARRSQAGGRTRGSTGLDAALPAGRQHAGEGFGAFRWRRLLEDGIYASSQEVAAAEKINPSYVSRILRMTLLAPDLVKVTLNGQHPADLTLERLLKPFPIEWEEQSDALRLAEYSTLPQE